MALPAPELFLGKRHRKPYPGQVTLKPWSIPFVHQNCGVGSYDPFQLSDLTGVVWWVCPLRREAPNRPLGHFWAGEMLLFFLLRPKKTVRACMQDNPLPTTKHYRSLKESSSCLCTLTILVWEHPRFQTRSLPQAREPGTQASSTRDSLSLRERTPVSGRRDNPRAQSSTGTARRHRLDFPA